MVNNSLAEVREDRADPSKLVDEISGLNRATLHWRIDSDSRRKLFLGRR
jgi:hypothetical protein